MTNTYIEFSCGIFHNFLVMESGILSAKDNRLLWCVTLNDVKGAKAALDDGADVNLRPEDGLTCVHLAAEKGFIEMIKLLLSQPNVQLDNLSSFGWSALSNATLANHLQICKLLLKSGADPNRKLVFDQTSLHVAVFNKRSLIVSLLIKKGADVNAVDCFHQSPLYVAVLTQPSGKIARSLLSAGANPNFTSETGLPLLTEAVLACRSPSDFLTIEFLLHYGADILVRDNIKEETPLHKAALNGSRALVKFLVTKGAEFDAVNSYGEKPIDVALLHNNFEAYLELSATEDFYTLQELRSLSYYFSHDLLSIYSQNFEH